MFPNLLKMVQVKRLKLLRINVMGLYNRITGSTGNETRIKEPKPFKPIELEQTFGGAYRSYRVNGRPKIDVDTFFSRIRKELIELIKRELKLEFKRLCGLGLLGMTRRARKELS